MKRLPNEFLAWNYYWRRNWALKIIKGRLATSSLKNLLEVTRILPAVCTAKLNDDGTITTNAKIIGAGFVPKRKYLEQITKVFKAYIVKEGMDAGKTVPFGRHEFMISEDRVKLREYQKKSLKLLVKYLYLIREEAEKKMDFTKLCTIELGHQYPDRPGHMWEYVQKNNKVTLLYFTPPTLSYEVRCSLEVHLEGPYFDFTHAVHDVYFGEDPSEMHLPVYIFNVEEVYNNSASPRGYGIRLV